MTMFTLVLKVSATAIGDVLTLVANLAKTDILEVMHVESIPVKDAPSPRGYGGRHARPCPDPPVQPITAGNPFVAQAVESSSMRKRIQAQKAPPSGRNRVIYEVTGTPPEGAVIKGVPAQIMNHLMTYAGSHSMSAKQIEVQLGLKRKSVESALYLLRTLGVVQSIAI